jgi:glycosyltransferase involved in cell wall biosynthesis
MLPDNIFWKCVIVGDGPQLYILNALSAKKGINDRVIIKTNVSDDELWKEYEKASIFILPSIIDKGTEGFGIVLLEAMAHSVPVIASNTGGIAEVLDNGSCGVLVEPGNAAAISEAIKKLYGDINLRSALSQKAYNRVRTFYAW